MKDAVKQFADCAREYRDWVLNGTDHGPQAARRALELIGKLYFGAIELPPRWCDEKADLDIEPPSIPGWDVVYKALILRLPFRYYGEVFNPIPVPAEPSIVADLADDLADIFHDIDQGLWWFDRGNRTEAVWQWGFSLLHHWGEHATSAIRALHCWLASEEPELLAKSTDR